MSDNDENCSPFRSVADRNHILGRLRLLGITSVTVDFAGSGDSGNINDVSASSGDKFIDISDEKILWHETKSTPVDGEWQNVVTDGVEQDLTEVLKDLTNDALETTGLDWYNNDGGQGELTIDFTQSPPEITLNVGINITQVESNTFDFTHGAEE